MDLSIPANKKDISHIRHFADVLMRANKASQMQIRACRKAAPRTDAFHYRRLKPSHFNDIASRDAHESTLEVTVRPSCSDPGSVTLRDRMWLQVSGKHHPEEPISVIPAS